MIARQATALAVLAVLLLAPSAGATQILVNGDTPAVRFSALADSFNVPLPAPDHPLILRIGACPGRPTVNGCYVRPVSIWVSPQSDTRRTFAHELGHAFDYHELTTHDRTEVLRLWGAPTTSWEEPSGGTHSSGIEVFAKAYAACALNRKRGGFTFGDWAESVPPVGWPVRRKRAATALRATCRLIERAGQATN